MLVHRSSQFEVDHKLFPVCSAAFRPYQYDFMLLGPYRPTKIKIVFNNDTLDKAHLISALQYWLKVINFELYIYFLLPHNKAILSFRPNFRYYCMPRIGMMKKSAFMTVFISSITFCPSVLDMSRLSLSFSNRPTYPSVSI